MFSKRSQGRDAHHCDAAWVTTEGHVRAGEVQTPYGFRVCCVCGRGQIRSAAATPWVDAGGRFETGDVMEILRTGHLPVPTEERR